MPLVSQKHVLPSSKVICEDSICVLLEMDQFVALGPPWPVREAARLRVRVQGVEEG